MEKELRIVKAGPETGLRFIPDDTAPRLEGHAAVFDTLSEDLGGFREKIDPGAFDRALREKQDVKFFVEHDKRTIMGRTKNGTLRLENDGKGLKVTLFPPDTQAGRDLMKSVERGDIDEMSFGFKTKSDSWEMKDGVNLRTLLDVDLFDVSAVAFPAYPDTKLALRSLEQHNNPNPPGGDPPGEPSAKAAQAKIVQLDLFNQIDLKVKKFNLGGKQ